MSTNDNPFDEDWRDCLREQFKTVIREDDRSTLETLVGVMEYVGFSSDELNNLSFEATLRTEDLSDAAAERAARSVHAGVELQAEPAVEAEREPEPPPLTEADAELLEQEMVISEVEVEEAVASEVEALTEAEPEDQSPAADDADGPRQMSLF